MSTDSTSVVEAPATAGMHLKARSRVSNHRALLPEVEDGRSTHARRFRDLIRAYVADMGGVDRCSEIKVGLLRRLAATTVQAEMLEAKMVNGEYVDVGTLCLLARPRSGWHTAGPRAPPA